MSDGLLLGILQVKQKHGIEHSDDLPLVDVVGVQIFHDLLHLGGQMLRHVMGQCHLGLMQLYNGQIGDVTKALNADRKEVDKAFAELKKEGAIVSPVRCKWAPAE